MAARRHPLLKSQARADRLAFGPGFCALNGSGRASDAISDIIWHTRGKKAGWMTDFMALRRHRWFGPSRIAGGSRLARSECCLADKFPTRMSITHN